MTTEGDAAQFAEERASNLISVAAASRISINGESLTPRHIRRLLKQNIIDGIQIGRYWYTTEEAVRDYLLTERRPGPRTPLD